MVYLNALEEEKYNIAHAGILYDSNGKITEEKVYRVDSSYFEVFTLPFIKGDPKTALQDVKSIAISALILSFTNYVFLAGFSWKALKQHS